MEPPLSVVLRFGFRPISGVPEFFRPSNLRKRKKLVNVKTGRRRVVAIRTYSFTVVHRHHELLKGGQTYTIDILQYYIIPFRLESLLVFQKRDQLSVRSGAILFGERVGRELFGVLEELRCPFVKYVHEHLDPSCEGTRAFISQPGARIADIQSIPDFVPATTKTLVLHMGTNGMAFVRASGAFHHVNRRRGRRNHDFVRRCNSEACRFNRLLRGYCRRSRNVFYVDHDFH
ncbi:hypothetical protein HPB52_003743 [Rhipicephalus sanguineus]|uniref:Uncharacterized protein n=1 Tax=Rhipicephalus sanguineus TaxID=34632 RepID=A0A9D4SXJ0_RHISA|nr:hypothetical protein HPB52_003743 [Rhipicephalus sanguineus]